MGVIVKRLLSGTRSGREVVELPFGKTDTTIRRRSRRDRDQRHRGDDQIRRPVHATGYRGPSPLPHDHFGSGRSDMDRRDGGFALTTIGRRCSRTRRGRSFERSRFRHPTRVTTSEMTMSVACDGPKSDASVARYRLRGGGRSPRCVGQPAGDERGGPVTGLEMPATTSGTTPGNGVRASL